MKQLFMIAALLFSVAASAQTTKTGYTGQSSSTATLTTLTTPTNYFSGNNGIWSAYITATRRSGTIPTTYVILQSKTSNGTWAGYYGTSADTFTLTNTASAQVHHWPVNTGRATNVRLFVSAASGTDTVDYVADFIKN